jgi:hypothetical protein
LAAAFLAAADGQVVRMSHIAHAARREYQKMGKINAADRFIETVETSGMADAIP